MISAQGQRDAQILEAEGQAKARLAVAEAEAQALTMITKALGAGNPAQYLIAQRYLESLTQIAAGSNKTVFIPFESVGTLGAAGSLKEIFKES